MVEAGRRRDCPKRNDFEPRAPQKVGIRFYRVSVGVSDILRVGVGLGVWVDIKDGNRPEMDKDVLDEFCIRVDLGKFVCMSSALYHPGRL